MGADGESLKVKSAYLDGELCALNAEGCAGLQPPVGRYGRRPDRSAGVLGAQVGAVL
jgi:hypothetical protein